MIFFKMFLLSVILVAFTMLALAVKLLVNPKAEFSLHTCAFKEGDKEEGESCQGCQINQDSPLKETK